MNKINFNKLPLLVRTIILCIWLLIAGNINAQEKADYEQLWSKVEKLKNEGKSTSALEAVDNIYEQAIKAGDEDQQIKAIIHRNLFKGYKEENAFEHSLSEMESELELAEEPSRSILHSALAEMYWWYYSANRWKILERSSAQTTDTMDLSTWRAKDLIEKVSFHYSASLAHSDLLKKESPAAYDLIWEKSEKGRDLRPSLYDVLVWRAIDFFSNSESGLNKPKNQFLVNGERYFAAADVFIKLEIEEPDSLSFQLRTVLLYRDLLSFHLTSGNSKALDFNDLRRLNYIRSNDISPYTDSLYLKGLQQIRSRSSNDITSEVIHAIAVHYNELGGRHRPGKEDEFKWFKKKSMQLCREAIEKFPDTYGAKQCHNLSIQLLRKTITISTENVVLPKQKFLSLIQHSNVSKVYYRIIENDVKIETSSDRSRNFILRQFIQKPFLFSGTIDLRDESDYQLHRTEVSLPALNKGYYSILLSLDSAFTEENNLLVKQDIWTSSLAYFQHSENNGEVKIHVTDRQSGAYLKDVTAQLYIQKYNYQNREQDLILSATTISDENGQIILKSEGENLNYLIMLSYRSDSLLISSPIYLRKFREPVIKSTIQSYIFTDRAIYRPGQQIYFKGIVIQRTGIEIATLKSKNLDVSIFDANNQEVGKVSLSTNEFGTYQGSFPLPVSGLTGRFYITDGAKRLYFKVEQYKRPNFRIVVDSLKGNYTVGEKVTISGVAENYSGSPLQAASVSYRIVRNTTFPFYNYYYYRFPVPQSAAAEIEHGELLTDKQGKWKLEFTALPDYKLKKRHSPVYNYTLELSVTDINGETQQNKTRIVVGYQSLMISLDLKDEMQFHEVETLTVNSTNLQGKFTAAIVDIEIYQLNPPENLLRKRLWTEPDYQLIDEQRFKADHPLDPYLESQDLSKWVIIGEPVVKQVNTGENKQLNLNVNSKWNSGAILVRLTSKDPYGNKVTWEKRIVLFTMDDQELPIPSWLWVKTLQDEHKVGETAQILVGSSKKGWLFYSFRDKTGLIKESWMKMNGKMQRIGIPIIEDYRGNIGIQFFLVHSGRSYLSEHLIKVPYDNKKLNVQLETHRNEFKPGEKLSWNLKLTGERDKGKSVEVLASMYDMSLDAFGPNKWAFGLYNTYRPIKGIFTGNNFSQAYGRNFQFFKDEYKQISPRSFDRLNWFGFNLYSGGYGHAVVLMDMAETVEGEVHTNGKIPKSGRAAEKRQKKSQEDDLEDVVVDSGEFQLRRDFRETAFFYPNLKPDTSGKVAIDFMMPDALTRWKFQAIVHSKELEYAVINKEFVTKKELMIMPNYPRFFTTGDTLILSAKVVNVSDKEINGNAVLQTTSYPEAGEIGLTILSDVSKAFKVAAESSELVSWKIVCPNNAGLVELKLFAESENHKDGEQKVIPVLSNKVLVTDTYPISLRAGQKKNLEVKHVESDDKQAFRYTLELTENPIWYVVQALPYLADPGNESSEQIFSRFFANSVSFGIIQDNPQIARVFDFWKTDPSSFESKLEKNQELKQVILSETPWVLDAKSDSENMKNMANFFDANSLEQSLRSAVAELLKLQTPNGGWPWFKGMHDNRYITQNIVRGFGKLHKMGFHDIRKDQNLWTALQLAIEYMDKRMDEDYQRILKHTDGGKGNFLSPNHIQYLYARSFYDDVPLSENHKQAFNYFMKQGKEHWLKTNKYLQAMLAIIYKRNDEIEMAEKIMISLKENALQSDEFGMYWKKSGGYYWHQSDLEKQAMLIEAFNEVSNDSTSVEEMKIWLIKQKQSQMWRTSKATTEACWALLTKGKSGISSTGNLSVKLGGKKFEIAKYVKIPGSGYSKTAWTGSEILPEMSEVEVENKGESLSWGAAYFQYFSNADQVESQAAGLSVSKEFYQRRMTDAGPEFDMVKSTVQLKTGDIVLVRLIIKSDRNLEFVHLKDKRASGLEPVDVNSGYRYKGGMGYYLSVRDASHNFYFGRLNKGTYVLEYELKANNKGDFSAGFAHIQCYYAPEFSARSKGVRVRVE